jgi:hypothetical protein
MEAQAFKEEIGNWVVEDRESKFTHELKAEAGADSISLCLFDERQKRKPDRVFFQAKSRASNCASIGSWAELKRELESHKSEQFSAFIFENTWGDFHVSAKRVERSSSAELELIFSGLVKHWQDATGGYSVTTRRYAHPSYHAILVLKEDVVPLILRELETRPDWWFEALQVLTKSNPVKSNASFEEAVNSWIEWGKANNKIPK